MYTTPGIYLDNNLGFLLCKHSHKRSYTNFYQAIVLSNINYTFTFMENSTRYNNIQLLYSCYSLEEAKDKYPELLI